MKRTQVKVIGSLFFFVILCISIMAGKQVAAAADSTVKIYIGSSTTARHHMAIRQGTVSEEYSFELKDATAKSSTYTSSNPSAFRIVSTGTGRCKVEALAEGTGLVTLTVKTTKDKTLTEKVFVSVYTKIGPHQAKAAGKTDVYRGATSQAGVENEDKKGTLSAGEQVTVTASCGSYYIIKTNDGSVYEDNKDTGFVKKNDVSILVESVAIQEQNISVAIGESRKLTASVAPGLAADKSMQWKSENAKTASVTSSGTITGKTEGTTTVLVSAKDGSSKAGSTDVTVYKKMGSVPGFIKSGTDLYALGNTKKPIGTGKAGTALTIVGTCQSYYRIKVAAEIVPKEYNGYCYIAKTRVTIPVSAVKLNVSRLILQPGKKAQLTATVVPNLADNKAVTWSSSDKKIATVSRKGTVTAKKAGNAVITVTSVDGKKTAQCEITVSEKKEANKKIQSKTSLSVKSASMGSLEIVVGNLEAHNGFRLYINGKKYDDYTYGKMIGTDEELVEGLRVNKTYKIQARTFIKKGKKRIYHKMSAVQKVTTGRITISANVIKNKAITVRWGKIKGVKQYRIYRAGKRNGKYKLLKKVKKSKNSYTDKAVKLNKTYYYKVKPINKKGKKGSSNIDYATACKLKSVAKYIAKKYSVVCTEKKKNIHSYNINGIYSPVKYRFADGILEIHVYLEFVTYHDTGRVDEDEYKIFKKEAASVQSEVSTAQYISMFKKGIERAYSIHVTGGKGDFKKGINFDTRLMIHEKGKEKYHAKQNFFEVLIGGECPNCTSKGNHWYHAHPGGNTNAEGYSEYDERVGTVYMPTYEQVRANNDEGYRNPYEGENEYGVVAAHELGHVLGLDDAYADEKYDRCAENDETGYKYSIMENFYDNVMKGGWYYKLMNANEIEMLLEAVNKKTGLPREELQHFKSYGKYNKKRKKNEYVISKVIKNHTDYQKER